MSAFYSDNDANACAWMRELVRAGHITDGVVDGQSIRDLGGRDLERHERVHLFAGIGGWDHALNLAGWTGPVWTGSCPCQPFSSAGKGRGADDERHLWPEMLRLITECKPPVVFGEQVASKAGREWLAGVRADLEALGYEVGAADLCAAGAGAPHIRQRLWWVAHSQDTNGRGAGGEDYTRRWIAKAGGSSCDGGVADTQRLAAERPGLQLGEAAGRVQGEARQRQRLRADAGNGRDAGGVADTSREPRGSREPVSLGQAEERTAADGRGEVGHWSDYELVWCRDPKGGDPILRRIEPGTFPLADGIPARVGRLRGYGNAIIPQVAAAFVRAYMEVQAI